MAGRLGKPHTLNDICSVPSPRKRHNGNSLKKAKQGVKFKPTDVTVSLVARLYCDNLLALVCMETRKFRTQHPDSGYVDLYLYLNEKFPDYFPLIPGKPIYSGNISKQIHSCKEWSAAYWSGTYDFDYLVETKLAEKVYNNDVDNKELIKIYEINKRTKENNKIIDEIARQVDFKLNIEKVKGAKEDKGSDDVEC